MELLETQDPEKRKLIETSERHKRELEKEVTEITAKTERMLTNTLIIGGSLILTYFLVRGFSGSTPKSKKKKNKAVTVVRADGDDSGEEDDEMASLMSYAPSLIAQIGNRVIDQATIVLLDMAREKLSEYLHPRKEADENS